MLETSVYILGLSYGWEKASACLTKNGKIVVNFSESHFSNQKDDYSFPKESIKACLNKEGLTLKDVAYIAFYDKPLLKFERIMKDVVFKAPFSFFRFMQTTKEWISEGKMLFKNQLCDELVKLYPGERLPEILFSEMPITKELLNVHLPKQAYAYDFGAACATWELFLKRPIPADNFQFYEHFSDEDFKSARSISLTPFMPDKSQLETKELKKFGLTMGALIIALFGFVIPYVKERPGSLWIITLGSLLIFLSLANANLLKKPYITWMVLAKIIGKLKSWAFYIVLYFLILCPYAFFARVFFRKSLSDNKAHTLDMKSVF